MSSHKLNKAEILDIYLSRSLKKWISRNLPPLGSRSRLLSAAVNQVTLKAARRRSRQAEMGVEVRNYSEYFNDLFAQSMARSLQSPMAVWHHI